MSKASIRSEISRLRREISKLQESKQAYEKMNNKIEKAIEELIKAGDFTSGASASLHEYYKDGEGVTQPQQVLIEQGENIEMLLNRLNRDMLDESRNKIKQIKKSIENKEDRIRKLKRQLERMDD